MEKSTFEIPQMDCPSEEQLIRNKLEAMSGVAHLAFDLPARQLSVFHDGPIDAIENALDALQLGSKRLHTEASEQTSFATNANQRKTLWIILLINFGFFLIESTTGIFSKSMGLVADSLDMLADAFVYGLSLFAVGGSLHRKKRIATIAGYLQISLAALGFLEVCRRFLGVDEAPEPSTMIIVSLLALGANALCLYLLQQSKNKEEAHMKASMIFTSNDVIINIGVMLAGLLVYVFQSNIPDLLIGTLVFVLVMRGALRILKLGR